MNILCIGDIVGKPGRLAFEGLWPQLRKEFQIDFVVVNAENVAGGAGITPTIARDLLAAGIDVITLGDHVWDQKDIEPYLNETDRVIRPANFPDGVPGRGWTIHESAMGRKVGVINMLGRVFMRHSVNCPFRTMKAAIESIKKQTSVIVVDMHTETTSEKVAMGHFLDGEVSVVFGTHTHIQTADERILPKGTAYITDLGMSGPYDSVIGQEKDVIIKRFLTSMPIRFSVAKKDVRLSGIVVEVEEKTGQAQSIQRLQRPFEIPEGALA